MQLRRVAALLAVAILIASVPFTASAAQATTVVPATLVTTGVTFADLTCVTFPSASVGYAAASDGTIVRTTNGGATWADVKTGGGQAFVGIAFWDAASGIAVTSDRQVWGTATGTSWSQINPDITANAGGTPQIKVNDVDSVPGTTDRAALAAGDPITFDENWYGEQLWLTWGSGAVYWGSQPVYESKSYLWDPEYGDTAWVGEGEFFDVDFVDGSNGWAVGADYYSVTTTSTIVRTTNGGQNWSKQCLGSGATLQAVSFASTLVGVTTSADGRAFYTTDGGASWTAGASGVTVSLNGVVMLDALNGYAVGNGGTVIKTTNGGVTWGPEVSGTTQDLLAVTAVNSTTAVAVGRAGTVVLLGATTDTTGPTMTSL
ncbi:MAG: YCF48-related protein, partial [Coriobacteriia bacterium]